MTKKVSKYDFAYQEGPGTPPRCDKCQYFIEGGKCLLVQGQISGVNGSCNYWAEGPVIEKERFGIRPFTKPESGYVENYRGPRCGTCTFYRDPRLCKLVQGDIDPKIGCCNAWKK